MKKYINEPLHRNKDKKNIIFLLVFLDLYNADKTRNRTKK